MTLSEARADRRRDRALEGDAVLLDRLEDVVGQRVAAVLVHDVGARLLHVPVELDAGGVEHPAGRLGKLGPGAVTGNEGHAMSHGRGVMVAGGRIGREDSSSGQSRRGRSAPGSVPFSAMEGSDFKPGLEGVVAFETEIAEPDKEGNALRYRGVDIEELVGHVPYEQVWGLLVDDSFDPGHAARRERRPAGEERQSQWRTSSPATAALAAQWGLKQLIDMTDTEARDDLARLSATMISIVAQSARGSDRVDDEIVSTGDTAAERFLLRWRGEADPRHVRAIDSYWVSAAEHGANASTFTGRIVASTGADCAAAHVGGRRRALRPAPRRRPDPRPQDARRGGEHR